MRLGVRLGPFWVSGRVGGKRRRKSKKQIAAQQARQRARTNARLDKQAVPVNLAAIAQYGSATRARGLGVRGDIIKRRGQTFVGLKSGRADHIIGVYEIRGGVAIAVPQQYWSGIVGQAEAEKAFAGIASAERAKAERAAREEREVAAYRADIRKRASVLVSEVADGSYDVLTCYSPIAGYDADHIVVKSAGTIRAVYRVDLDTRYTVRKITRVTKPNWPSDLLN